MGPVAFAEDHYAVALGVVCAAHLDPMVDYLSAPHEAAVVAPVANLDGIREHLLLEGNLYELQPGHASV